jgi:hypothetical protein
MQLEAEPATTATKGFGGHRTADSLTHRTVALQVVLRSKNKSSANRLGRCTSRPTSTSRAGTSAANGYKHSSKT